MIKLNMHGIELHGFEFNQQSIYIYNGPDDNNTHISFITR